MNLERDLDPGDVEVVAVLGAGTVGHGIAAVAALAGFEVRLRDISEEAVEEGFRDLGSSLEDLVEEGRVGEEAAAAARDRVTPLVDLEAAAADADFVVEAVPERPDLKKNLYRELAGVAPDRAVFATNTSALSVTDLSEATDRPERFCGMHFFNPPTRMDLVEVVGGAHTDEATLDLVEGLAEAMGKTPLRVGDSPGFVVNRVLFPTLNEAAWTLSEGDATAEAVDAAVRDGLGLPMGAFELVEHVGPDVVARILDVLHERLGAAYRPCPLLAERAGVDREGGDGSAGTHEHGAETPPGDDRDEALAPLVRRLRAVAANEVAKLLAADVAEVATIDRALVLGAGFPEGPAATADRVGVAALYGTLAERRDRTGAARYEPAAELARLVARGETFYGAADGNDATETGGSESEDGGGHGDPGRAGPFDALEIERRTGGVGHVRLNRPDRLNTISPELLDELVTAVERLEDDDGVRALLVTGAGDRAFSAGADVRAIAADAEPIEAAELARRGQSAFGRLEASPMPVVAGVSGYCLGGGMELATACDLRVGGRGATFGQPEHDLGLLPGFGGTQRLARLIGDGRAKEVIFTAERYGAERMAEYGFLNEVVESEAVTDRALELARDLAEGPPIAQALTKRAMRAGRDDVDAGLEVEAQAFGHLVGTADAEEGISAFLNDRDPEFEGE